MKGFISILEGGFIGALFVKVDCQGNGIGSELLEYVKNIYSNLTLTVYSENFNAVEFYKKEGFIVLDEHIDENVNRLELTMKYDEKINF
ncbi:MAG: GNAT family N-acetyltransferase [Clostridium sp.]|nr:GNAT family N-acetyltransferase [Clostridium sp.]